MEVLAITEADERAFGCPNCRGGQTREVLNGIPGLFVVKRCQACGKKILVTGLIEIGGSIKLTLHPSEEVLEGEVRSHPFGASVGQEV
ncbi:hypothetical protein A2480_03515 [Candidatus Uhrbacteria bacterium RIFOXYC2_FULL_47_19]|uniref:Uncharacterized protein n=1 Tax=Candidatus Uhrbacteria bacterium RIFOXYC2_FULL_47_19 TaxID=1802424 RepID=A0A1F7WBZ8_9BACT|nr:MAG: hypothetical protein A2480_03515 [Candidatus Uhrbacteria bacterium RIFOXYC2_FULL_47_19]